MLDLQKGDPDSTHHYHLQKGKPVCRISQSWFHKRVVWENIFLPDGTPGEFISWWIIGNVIHWYKGNVKCDGTRTRMYWNGQLDDGREPRYVPDADRYVMTTTEKEKLSVRFFVDPSEPNWDSMGGA